MEYRAVTVLWFRRATGQAGGTTDPSAPHCPSKIDLQEVAASSSLDEMGKNQP